MVGYFTCTYICTFPVTLLYFILFYFNLPYLLTYLLHIVETLKTNRFSASPIRPYILNLKAQYRIYKCQTAVPILSQINAVHTRKSHFLKIRLNIILPSKPGPSKWFFASGFPTKTLHTPLPFSHTWYFLRQPHSSRFDQPNNIW
jgi:hypothetical protein